MALAGHSEFQCGRRGHHLDHMEGVALVLVRRVDQLNVPKKSLSRQPETCDANN
uniref:Uncharacterized protein n=1 Tax=Triticum urartu TaxID=4572 RepID=A0A8R7TFQ3_TRIUA